MYNSNQPNDTTDNKPMYNRNQSKLIHVTSLKYNTSFAYIYIVSHIKGVLITARVQIFFKEGEELEERRGVARASLDHF